MSKIIAANWKMNGNLKLADDLLKIAIKGAKLSANRVIILPPAIFISYIKDHVNRDDANRDLVNLGGQNCYLGDFGAFTGEQSASMYAEFGAKYILVGHSERRRLFQEDNSLIANKFASIIAHNLVPILCVGETEAEYSSGKTFEILKGQLNFLKNIKVNKLIVAYEPVWAIGTGKLPTVDEITQIHTWLYEFLSKECLLDAATMSIIYGGSVNSANAKKILSLPNIDGVLVGGASLQPKDFLEIITCTI